MLRIHQTTNAAEAKRYYCGAYYMKGHELELVGDWGGRGAEMLGLSGRVGQKDFERLCDNLQPATGKPLTARYRDDRTVLYDFNFNAPKGLSTIYARYLDEDILDAVRSSIRETMDEAVEPDMKTRVRKRGQDGERTTSNIVYAEFIHLTARPVDQKTDPDMSVHGHICVFNATKDSVENQWKAGQFRDLKRDAPFLEAVFHSKLSAKIKALGFPIERKGRDWDVAGLSPELLRKFSKRTTLIEEKAKALGLSDPETVAKLGAKTRERKQKQFTLNELRERWDGQLTDAERKQLDAAYARNGDAGEPKEVTAAAAMQHAISKSFERESIASEKRLAAEALRFGYGDVSVDDVRDELSGHGIIRREREGQQMATTRAVLEEEQAMLAFARDGRGLCEAIAPGHTIERTWLNADQQAAVRHVLESTDRAMLIRGIAGTGKTTQMKETVDAIEAAGKSVVVVAPTAQSSRGVLRDQEGFKDADTLQRFLVDGEFQKKLRDGVLWIDEAGLVGSRDLCRAFMIADEQNARVVLQGDAKQHHSVPRGPALRLLEQQAGLVPVEIRDIRRQTGDYKAAVQALADGRTLEGFDMLDKKLESVHELKDGEQHKRLAAEYVAALKKGEEILAVSPTHLEGEQLTRVLRAELKRQKLLGADDREFLRLIPLNLTEAERADVANYRGAETPLIVQFVQNAKGFTRGERFEVRGVERDQLHVRSKTGGEFVLPLNQASRFQVYAPATMRMAAGDKIRITQNGMSADKHRLNNGSVYDVAGFTPEGDIRLGNGWRLAMDTGNIAPGWVMTSHASQGRTIEDRVLIAASTASLPAVTREMLYVSASRAKRHVAIFTDDKAALRQAVSRTDERLSATELLGGPLPTTPGRQIRSSRAASHVTLLQRVTTQAHAYASRVIDNVRDRVSELTKGREVAYE